MGGQNLGDNHKSKVTDNTLQGEGWSGWERLITNQNKKVTEHWNIENNDNNKTCESYGDTSTEIVLVVLLPVGTSIASAS